MNAAFLTPYLGLIKRLALPAGIMLVCLIVASGGLLYLAGVNGGLRSEHEQIILEMGELNREIRFRRERSELYDENARLYEMLVDNGFQQRHSRLDAAQIIQRTAEAHVLPEVTYEFSEEQRYPLDPPDGYEAEIISTSIALEIASLTDANVYTFIDEVIANLPGHAAIRSVDIARNNIANRNAANALRSGDDVTLVDASVVIDWSILAIQDRSGGRS